MRWGTGPEEVTVPGAVLRLDGRVLEVLLASGEPGLRIHVDHLSVVVVPVEVPGSTVVRIGVLADGGLHPVARNVRFELEDMAFARLRDLVLSARAARDAGPGG